MYNEMSYVYRIRSVKDWNFIVDEYNEGIRNGYFIERCRYNKTGWEMVHQCSSLEHAFERMKSILDDYENQKQFYEGASIFDTERFVNREPVAVNNNDAVAGDGCCSGTKVSCVNLTFTQAMDCIRKGMLATKASWYNESGYFKLKYLTYLDGKIMYTEENETSLYRWNTDSNYLDSTDWIACDTRRGLLEVLSVDES